MFTQIAQKIAHLGDQEGDTFAYRYHNWWIEDMWRRQ